MQLTNRPGGPVSEQSPYNGLLCSATIGIPSMQWENHDLEESLGVLMLSDACALDRIGKGTKMMPTASTAWLG